MGEQRQRNATMAPAPAASRRFTKRRIMVACLSGSTNCADEISVAAEEHARRRKMLALRWGLACLSLVLLVVIAGAAPTKTLAAALGTGASPGGPLRLLLARHKNEKATRNPSEDEQLIAPPQQDDDDDGRIFSQNNNSNERNNSSQHEHSTLGIIRNDDSFFASALAGGSGRRTLRATLTQELIATIGFGALFHALTGGHVGISLRVLKHIRHMHFRGVPATGRRVKSAVTVWQRKVLKKSGRVSTISDFADVAALERDEQEKMGLGSSEGSRPSTVHSLTEAVYLEYSVDEGMWWMME